MGTEEKKTGIQTAGQQNILRSDSDEDVPEQNDDEEKDNSKQPMWKVETCY
jgi:hypothetical protein